MSVTQEISPRTDRTTRRKLQKAPLTAIQRYGLAVVSVALALAMALALDHFKFRSGQIAPFLFAVAVTAWYGGGRAAVLALLLACFSFDYFFVEPRYTLYIAPSELPYFLLFGVFTSLVTWLSRVRRRVEEDLRHTRDKLEQEVTVRTQQANLLNLTSDMIFVRDMDAVITYWNRGAEQFYGFTEEEAIGKRHYELLRTVFPMPLDDLVAEVVRTGQWEGEVRHIKANGEKAVVLSRWSLQRDESDRPTAMLAINTDITDRKQGEEQIRALNEELVKKAGELEAINKELEAFAYSTSHDLRAPLRHMVGYTELLQKHASSTFDEKGRRYMATILEAAKKMGALIDDLLAFSRIGRVEAREANVSLEYLVKDVLSEMPAADGRKIDWKIGKLPEVYGDGSMLRLALVNLISNAVKFTRTRSRPEIEIGCVEKKDDQAIVFVKDNGVGFDMKYAHKLFGVFQRLHSTQVFEGTGIGLATVQRIIHRHRGRVWAESAVDKGATFYFSVPTKGN